MHALKDLFTTDLGLMSVAATTRTSVRRSLPLLSSWQFTARLASQNLPAAGGVCIDGPASH
jgi:hypothetical protein